VSVLRILIVDDDEPNRYQLQVLLGGSGYEVVAAANGAEALTTARQNPPDLVISDVLMPVMDGFTMCREWKKDERLRQIPFVFYTATYTDERDREFALSLGAERFLVKPEEQEVFIRTIREVIQQVQRPPAPPSPPAATAPGRLPVEEPSREELGYLSQYNEVLIRKLEAKMQQLEQANRELERDITERKQAEAALRASEAKFRALSESAPAAIFIYQGNGFRYANPAMEVITGYSQHELLSMNFWDIVHPDFREFVRDRGLARQRGDPVPLRYEFKILTKAGEERWLGFADGKFELEGKPAVVGFALDITESKRAEAALRQMSGRLLRLQEEERRRIARELHDTTAQSLTALALNLSVVKDSAPNLSPRANACLSESLGLAEECSREIRTLSYLLHPPLLDDTGLGSALRWFVDGYTQRTGIHVDLEMPTELTRLPGDIELALYRIVQEGLTNIHLHSGSKKARICLECRPNQAVLTVADEGRGLPPGLLERGERDTAKRGVGISGMRERVRQLGGQFEIVTGSNGTTLTASMPLREEPA
jgi:PAS domain S-box-containing protein